MRQKLTIKEVLELKSIGDKGAQLQEFIAGDGKKYGTFTPSFFPFIKQGAEIDVQWEEEKKGEFINRRIKGIFIDGKLVKAQQRFGGNRGKSPEELELSSRSYALSYAKDLAAVSKIEVGNILDKATEFYNWMQVKPIAVKDTAKLEVLELPVRASTKLTKDQAKRLIEEMEAEQPLFPEADNEQKERLKELQEKLPGRSLQLIKEWGWGVKSITKLTKDQAKHLIEVMEAEQPLFYPKAGE